MKSQLGEYSVAASDFRPKFWLLDYPGYIERERVRDYSISYKVLQKI